jgi:TetR/AcrR family transcriptional repressor of nem operon
MLTKPRSRSDTATRILDTAELLVQQRGFNGFSYADVAAELGVTAASLHYHFSGKAELGLALAQRYRDRFVNSLALIDERSRAPSERLNQFVELYASVLRQQRMCLCGMLAAEYATLGEPMRGAVMAFFEEVEAWVAGVLQAGRRDGSLRFPGVALDHARALVACLEGAMLIARPRNDEQRFLQAASLYLACLSRKAERT